LVQKLANNGAVEACFSTGAIDEFNSEEIMGNRLVKA